jgi:hypothetical protein
VLDPAKVDDIDNFWYRSMVPPRLLPVALAVSANIPKVLLAASTDPVAKITLLVIACADAVIFTNCSTRLPPIAIPARLFKLLVRLPRALSA